MDLSGMDELSESPWGREFEGPDPSLEAAAEILQSGGHPRGPFIPQTLLHMKLEMLVKEVERERVKVKMIQQYNIPEDLIIPEKDPRKKLAELENELGRIDKKLFRHSSGAHVTIGLEHMTVPEEHALGPEDNGPMQWGFINQLPRYPDGRVNLSAMASQMPPHEPGLPKDGHDEDIESILYRFGFNAPTQDRLNSIEEFYDEMFDEEGLPFHDAPVFDGADRNPVLYDSEGNEDDFDHEEYDPFDPQTACKKFCKAVFQENSRVIWDTLLDPKLGPRLADCSYTHYVGIPDPNRDDEVPFIGASAWESFYNNDVFIDWTGKQHNTVTGNPLNDITPMRMLMIAPQRDSNRAILRALLPHVDVNRRDKAGWSYLHFLAARFDTTNFSARSAHDVVLGEILLNNGLHPNTADPEGFTALHVAARVGNAAMAEMLLARGANPNAMSESRSTPLHLTTIGPMTEKTARVLISVNAVDHIKQTPLHGAANFCRHGLAKIFVDHGARLTPKDTAGGSAAECVSRSGGLAAAGSARDGDDNQIASAVKAEHTTSH